MAIDLNNTTSHLTADEKALLSDLRDAASGWTWWKMLTDTQKADRQLLVANHLIVRAY